MLLFGIIMELFSNLLSSKGNYFFGSKQSSIEIVGLGECRKFEMKILTIIPLTTVSRLPSKRK